MAKLTPKQIAAAARQAGFQGDALVEIVAIALAESGGNPNALNPTGEHSVGLTQINMNAHGTRFGTETQLRDPVVNMRAAFQLSGGGKNLRPWSVHRTSPSPHAGASDRHLDTARRAAAAVGEDPRPHRPRGGRPGGDEAFGDRPEPHRPRGGRPGGDEAFEAQVPGRRSLDGPGGDPQITQAEIDDLPDALPPEERDAESAHLNSLWTHMFQSMSDQIRQGFGEETPAPVTRTIQTMGAPLDEADPSVTQPDEIVPAPETEPREATPPAIGASEPSETSSQPQQGGQGEQRAAEPPEVGGGIPEPQVAPPAEPEESEPEPRRPTGGRPGGTRAFG